MSDPPAPAPLHGIKSPALLVTEALNISENWKLFKQKWNNYQILTQLDKHPRDYQVAPLLHTLGDDALKICNGLKFDKPEEERTVKEILDAFENFAIGEVNETYERFKFNHRSQKEGESFDLFLSDLRKLVKSCNYCGTCVNSILRDRIVLGILYTTTQQALLKERNRSLERTIDTCRAAENAVSHHKALNINQDNVNKLSHPKRRRQKPKPKLQLCEAECKFCGKVHPWKKEHCPAYGKTCSKCGEKNHPRSKCPSSERQIQKS